MENLTVFDCVIYSLIGFLVVFGTLLLLAVFTKVMSAIVMATEKKPAPEGGAESK